jgi:hypothetical protein
MQNARAGPSWGQFLAVQLEILRELLVGHIAGDFFHAAAWRLRRNTELASLAAGIAARRLLELPLVDHPAFPRGEPIDHEQTLRACVRRKLFQHRLDVGIGKASGSGELMDRWLKIEPGPQGLLVGEPLASFP